MFGKSINDLQSNVVVGSNAITGTLKYVNGYTGFSSNTEEQSGNYLVIHASTPNVENATITVEGAKPMTLDNNGIAVLGIVDKNSQTLTVVASKEGYQSATKVFNLTGLIVEVPPNPTPEGE